MDYRFSYWFVVTHGSTGIVVSLVSLVTLIIGAMLYSSMIGRGIKISLWTVFVWLVAPDAGAGEATYAGCAIGLALSIMGLVIFALVLTILSEGFQGYLDSIKLGTTPVVESGHILLIGLTDETMPLIQELCWAYEKTGGTVIAVLSDELTIEEMDAKIKDSTDPRNTRIVVRSGKAEDIAHLKHVSADSAKTVIVMADRAKPKELRDAFVMQAVLALRSEGWPFNGNIVAVCSLV